MFNIELELLAIIILKKKDKRKGKEEAKPREKRRIKRRREETKHLICISYKHSHSITDGFTKNQHIIRST